MPAAIARREGGHVHQHPAAGAVARQGARPAGRRALASCGSCTTWPSACMEHYADSTDDARLAACRNLHVGLPRARRRSDEPYAEAVLQGDQRLHGRRRRAGPGLRRAQGRRLDRLRLLDLLRRVRRRRQPGRAAATRATSTRPGGWVSPEWGWAWPANRRMLYNRASADPDGQAVVGAQEVRLVGRGAGQVDRLRRPRLPGRQAPRLPRADDDARAWTRSPATSRSS